MPKTDYLSNRIIETFLRNGSQKFLGLFLFPPSKTGGWVEVSASDYARRSIVFSEPNAGISQSVGAINFPETSNPWGLVTYFGIFDSQTVGNLLYFGPLATARQIQVGSRLVIQPGEVSLVEY